VARVLEGNAAAFREGHSTRRAKSEPSRTVIAVPEIIATESDAAEYCETFGATGVELFGYRHPSGWRWFCALHRLGQFYADKRLLPSPEKWAAG
jgi:hypothetical protein